MGSFSSHSPLGIQADGIATIQNFLDCCEREVIVAKHTLAFQISSQKFNNHNSHLLLKLVADRDNFNGREKCNPTIFPEGERKPDICGQPKVCLIVTKYFVYSFSYIQSTSAPS